ncbi:hypothetical protein SCP_0507050 [Sparassis crispa]|uniref:Uncharacterized protein n=1 Tax=Sparassis crispa TaxID=139825 RepID=A0A401GN98_9APHY|nr:hypothetical protein SCP_0507050 [Sparassis crispa]GBE83650.1 hypothetical protein SCP_0507050 [Sparassis crispa]
MRLLIPAKRLVDDPLDPHFTMGCWLVFAWYMHRSWFSHWMLTPVSPHTTYDVLHCAAAVEWLMEARLRAHTSIPLIMECGWMARTPVHELDRVGALLEPFFRIRTG